MKPIRVLLADSQYLIRAGLRHLLSPHEEIEVVAEAASRESFLSALEKTRPDVLVLDYLNPSFFGIGELETIRSISPDTQILIISSDENKENIFRVLELGINAYLTKSCGAEEILSAIRTTAKGEKFFCNKVLDIILEKQFSKTEEDCKPSRLTDRETEIVTLISKGMTTKEIAGTLFLSHHTVNTHRRNIMRKLKVSSSSELMIYAVNEGILRP
jgi:DNA-binding NarL/FixJ family response regulator